MIKVPSYTGKHIAVFGLARTGLAAVRALSESGADVLAWDDDQARCAMVGALAHNLYEADFSDIDGLLVAPGVPLTHPEPHALVKKAMAADVPIFGDTDVFEAARDGLPSHDLIAITGTNGKSTTSALIDHMVQCCGKSSSLGGNIGTGILSLAPLEQGGVYVFELSSYQLDLTHALKPSIAILMNISPDHLDRHGGMDGYTAAKAHLFDLLADDGVAIISVDDPHSRRIADKTHQRKILMSVEQRLDDGVSLQGDTLLFCVGGAVMGQLSLARCATLKGNHNAQNAAAAWVAGHILGFDNTAIQQAFETFPGLVHRQELIGCQAGVTFINDSKATNVEAAARALASYQSVHWIAGGRGKNEPLDILKPWLGRVKKAWLIGEDADRMAKSLGQDVDAVNVVTLEAALAGACVEAEAGDTILLSPACASFDQYESFEDRGDCFRRAVGRWLQKGHVA